MCNFKGLSRLGLGGRSVPITSDQILEAILSNRCVDGREQVLGPRTNRDSFMPPILVSYFEARYGYESTYDYLGGMRSRRLEGLVPSDRLETIREFEELSLKARENLAERLLSGSDVYAGQFPTIEGSALVEAIAAAAAKFACDDESDQLPKTKPAATRGGLLDLGRKRLAARRGLQVVACYVQGDVDLVSLELPFSVRLIGCVIDGAVTANHLSLTTLDLSGSALRGIHATALEAYGSVRLRRTVSTGPVDLGGARIGGAFDATECVVFPTEDDPRVDSFAGDRGIFNLALASIGTEFYANRARIYGGLCMNSCSVSRAIHLEDAVIHSPMSLVQRMAFSQYSGHINIEDERDNPNLSIIYELAGTKSGARDAKDRDFIEERLIIPSEVSPILMRLLSESARARTSALRADSLRAGGSFFATGIRVSGRCRLRFAKIEGALQLYGCRLQSPAIIRRQLLQLAGNGGLPLLAWENSRKQFPLREVRKLDGYALDIRDASFGGDVMLSPDRGMERQARRDQVSDLKRKLEDHSILEGTLGARGVNIAGDLNLASVTIVSERLADYESRKVELSGRQGSREREYAAERSIILNHASLGGNLILNGTRGLYGVSAEQAKFAGDVMFAPAFDPELGAWYPAECCSHTPIFRCGKHGELNCSACRDDGEVFESHHHFSVIDFKSARIQGDAIFLFSPNSGPSLDLKFLNVDGHLAILPWFSADDERRKEALYEAIFRPEDPPGQGRDGNSTESKAKARAEIGAAAEAARKRRADSETKARAEFDAAAEAARKTRASARYPFRAGIRQIFEELQSAGPVSAIKQIARAVASRINKGEGSGPIERAPCSIDLRHAFASVFTHHPLAWPEQHGLRIGRFVYEAARKEGPLAPFPIPKPLPKPWLGLLIWLPFLTVFAAWISLLFIRAAPGGWMDQLGQVHLIILFMILSLRYSLFGFGRTWQRTWDTAQPMAIRWLELQRIENNNPRSEGGSMYWPQTPYLQAADVLRGAGRFTEAGWVEKARFREWCRLLSARLHFVPYVFLKGIDLVSEFGFNPTRIVFVVLVLVLVGGMTFNVAYKQCGAVAWVSVPPMLETTTDTAAVPASPSSNPRSMPVRPAFGSKGAGDAKRWPPPFEPLVYAAEITVPFLDLREEDRWEIIHSANCAPWKVVQPLQGLVDFVWDDGMFFRWTKIAGKTMGVILTALVAAAIAARARMWLARMQD